MKCNRTLALVLIIMALSVAAPLAVKYFDTMTLTSYGHLDTSRAYLCPTCHVVWDYYSWVSYHNKTGNITTLTCPDDGTYIGWVTNAEDAAYWVARYAR